VPRAIRGAPTTVVVHAGPTATGAVLDAGPTATGAVLLQQHGDDMRIIEYASKSLTHTEIKYGQIEKKALALLHGCEKFKFYLLGGPKFTFVTDHKLDHISFRVVRGL
jgi:hypothetical protein